MTKYCFPDLSNFEIFFNGRRYKAFKITKEKPFNGKEEYADFVIWDGLYDAEVAYGVMRNDKFYGEFDSLIEAKEYVENWVRINPKDYVDGGGVGKMNYADGRKFRIRVKQKKG